MYIFILFMIFLLKIKTILYCSILYNILYNFKLLKQLNLLKIDINYKKKKQIL